MLLLLVDLQNHVRLLQPADLGLRTVPARNHLQEDETPLRLRAEDHQVDLERAHRRRQEEEELVACQIHCIIIVVLYATRVGPKQKNITPRRAEIMLHGATASHNQSINSLVVLGR